ncbi:MAG TPA: P27 family phage terminase small subunit [Nitrospiraceae bacterium]|nr:P27 family phage terminase small subunit [Nitrospiraceae bacterium]
MGNHNSGRRPLPTSLKVLRGNPGKRHLNELEPKPVAGPVEKPGYLSVGAAEVWGEIAQGCLAMGTLTPVDVPAFARLCELEFTARIFSRHKDDAGWKNQREERDCAIVLKSYYDFFGMTPSGRSRIKVPKQAPDEPASKWSGALK